MKVRKKKLTHSKKKTEESPEVQKKQIISKPMDYSSSSSDTEIEVETKESDDSEIEFEESDWSANCNGYFMDKKGPKCDWIQCVSCSKWVHEICTPSDRFCDDCVPLSEIVIKKKGH